MYHTSEFDISSIAVQNATKCWPICYLIWEMCSSLCHRSIHWSLKNVCGVSRICYTKNVSVCRTPPCQCHPFSVWRSQLITKRKWMTSVKFVINFFIFYFFICILSQDEMCIPAAVTPYLPKSMSRTSGSWCESRWHYPT